MKSATDFLSNLLEIQNDGRVVQLEDEIRNLYHNHFERLLWVLYRLDVDEQKLTNALRESTLPEEKIITQLLLQRCNKILETRKEFMQSDESSNDNNSTENWSFDLNKDE